MRIDWVLIRVIIALGLCIPLVACEPAPTGELCPGCDPVTGPPARSGSDEEDAKEATKSSKIDPASGDGAAAPANDDAEGADDAEDDDLEDDDDDDDDLEGDDDDEDDDD